MSPLPLVVAHRGFSARHRENSPEAWQAALLAGADVVEVDLRVTRDGAVVCCHDVDLHRLTGQAVTVAEASAGELALLHAGSFPAAPALTLLFETLPASCSLLFDIKDERAVALEAILHALTPYTGRPMMLGLHAAATTRRARDAGWCGRILGFLSEREEEERFFAAGGDVLRIWEWDATPERLRQQAVAGRPAWITTGEGDTGRKVGDHGTAALRRMAKDGAAAFLVNDPVAARDALFEVAAPIVQASDAAFGGVSAQLAR